MSESQRSKSSGSKISKDTLELRKKKREALIRYLELCGSDSVIKTTGSYHRLQPQSKANFLLSARTLIRSVIESLAPNDSIQVRQELFVGTKGKSSNNTLSTLYISCFFIEIQTRL